MPKQVSLKFDKILQCLITMAICLLIVPQAFPNTVEIAVLSTSSQQRAVYAKHEKDFEQKHPDIDVNIKFLSDADFKQALSQWLNNANGPEILTWQGGQRLFQLVAQKKVLDLSEFWKKHGLLKKFSVSSTNAISVDDSRYGVPASYYQWGIYYRQSLFDKLSLSPPKTWQDLIKTCEVLLKNEITPITIGAANKWTSAAWFDYLNLRVNGLTYHQELLMGEHSFRSPQVREVFIKWHELLNKGCFTDRFNGWDWSQAMPFLYHKMAGMTLIGNFFASTLPKTLENDFRFVAFPTINPEMPLYEEAPLDLFMVPSYTKMTPAIEQVLLSLTSTNFLALLNDAATTISPTAEVLTPSKNYFISEGQNLLSKAKGVSQFFDRDTKAAMASASTEIFTRFMVHKDIERTLNELEDARERFLLK
ncbi:ABC transporter substrate-binding protein [Agaribacter marinus]|uniref:ABC transporter substrate-binding protein n=1 Tax=Agaribacter marinus TaxID=1431249 RepID=A0AA37T4M3_9ALTE|nr:extracellular solute-binding protein [Agaribacter marinus]GLR71978.1 ABC transporter substrate-binding protein [Agaribacter marinus]